jgi:hypothetical protein
MDDSGAHLACALARNQSAALVLLRLIVVPHPSYLGTDFGNLPPTRQQAKDLREYVATAEDYGVALSLQFMQCVHPLEALADAAHQLDADVLFAHLPTSWIPRWQDVQTWRLKRRLGGIPLFTLDSRRRDAARVPTITVESTPIRS